MEGSAKRGEILASTTLSTRADEGHRRTGAEL